MNITRTEIRTGLLVVVSLAILVAVLIFLGAPGVFVPQNTYRIYFDNAAGIKPGAQVLLAGRKIGQVKQLYSPVPEKERPTPKMETLIEVEVARSANVYNKVKVQITQPSLLGESVIDFSSGEEASGRASDGAKFLGERPGGLADAVPTVLEKLDPVLAKLTGTLESLQKTSDNLAKLSADGADLPTAFSEFKEFGKNLNEMSTYGGPLRNSLQNIEALTSEQGKLGQSLNHLATLTGPDGSLSKTFKNAEKFTEDLANNKDVPATLRNFREASENLDRTLTQVGQQFSSIGANLEQGSDTLKRQPWRLIWPTTKKYPDDAKPAPTPKLAPTPKPRRATVEKKRAPVRR
jgi:ABC-type transporter Mla subunit MlaD